MTGRTEMIYLTERQYELAERVRKNLGFSKSGFYRYCVLHVLEEMSILSAEAKAQAERSREASS